MMTSSSDNSIHFSCDNLYGLEVFNMAACIITRRNRRLKVIPSDCNYETEEEKSYILSPDVSECEDDECVIEDVFFDVAKDDLIFKREENRLKCVSHSELSEDTDMSNRYRCSFRWSVSSC